MVPKTPSLERKQIVTTRPIRHQQTKESFLTGSWTAMDVPHKAQCKVNRQKGPNPRLSLKNTYLQVLEATA